MDPLATLDDLAGRLGRDLTDEEEARAGALLDGASARVRAYTRRKLSFIEDDQVVLRGLGREIRLPNHPVHAVTSVSPLGCGGTPSSVGWCWDGSTRVTADVYASAYQVTYTHGHDPVPDDIVDVVCAVALRSLLSPSPIPGMVSERIGAYNYQLQQGAGAPGASVRLSGDDMAALDIYRRRAGTIGVRL